MPTFTDQSVWRDGDWNGFVRIVVAEFFAQMCEIVVSPVLPHFVVQSLAPVAGFALGVGDGIDDDVIVELFEDDIEGEDAHVAMADLPLDGECSGIGG